MFLSQIGFIPNQAELYDHLQGSFLLVAIVMKTTILSVFACFFIALCAVFIAEYLAKHVGYLHKILWLSLLTLIAGHIPFLKELYKPGYVIGAILFSGFFFAAGAISDISEVLKLPTIIIAIPFIILFIHALFIIIAAKILKINNMTLFITSQTLIGGPGTAVAIAQAKKWKSGVSIMAVQPIRPI